MTKDADDFSAHSFFVPQSLVFPLNGARNCESETRKGRAQREGEQSGNPHLTPHFVPHPKVFQHHARVSGGRAQSPESRAEGGRGSPCCSPVSIRVSPASRGRPSIQKRQVTVLTTLANHAISFRTPQKQAGKVA